MARGRARLHARVLRHSAVARARDRGDAPWRAGPDGSTGPVRSTRGTGAAGRAETHVGRGRRRTPANRRRRARVDGWRAPRAASPDPGALMLPGFGGDLVSEFF